MCVVCVLMSGIKEKRHLEDIRKLHRKLREAKEDPTHAGLAGLSPRDGGLGGDSGYGETELGAGGIGAGVGAMGAGVGGGLDGLDQEVHLQMDDEPSAGPGAAVAGSYAAGKKKAASMAKAAKKAVSPKPRYEPEESVEEEGYDEQPAGATATGYDDEESAQGGAGSGYAQHDEYDEEEN